MTQSFLSEVVRKVFDQHDDFGTLVFVLPSKRAGVYLKKYISDIVSKPSFAPKIKSIEELISEVSELQEAGNLDLLLELFEVYAPLMSSEETSFESFITWGHTLLSDFNELDRYLIDYKSLFNYLTESQRLKSWGADKRATPLISNTLKFWERLGDIYEKFRLVLNQRGIGYQGLLYRKALEKAGEYLSRNKTLTFYFIGFNALNRAEEEIIQRFLEHGNTKIYWDIDKYFLNDPIHEAGFFIRNYLKTWPYLEGKWAVEPSNTFLGKKSIHITGVPKAITQAKYAGSILEKIQSQTKESIALVLADESLLNPILNSLPSSTGQINVTMGLPLEKTPLCDFFSTLFDLHIDAHNSRWYHKGVSKMLSNPYTIELLKTPKGDLTAYIKDLIRDNNLFFLERDFSSNLKIPLPNSLHLLFPKKEVDSSFFVANCLKIIELLKSHYQQSKHNYQLHLLFGFYQLFNQLSEYVGDRPYLASLKALKLVFDQLVTTAQIDFKGEPLGGLQIMGMLESRNLDFETVIITSVNEGVLPAGKTQNSFIPYDIKREFGLPTYKEKNAIYAYHFYRLLQRAKDVHIIYNTEPDVLYGNEKSRFISQLLADSKLRDYLSHKVTGPKVTIAKEHAPEIEKTPLLISRLEEMVAHGLSPTALSLYIRNPYDFYKKSVLRLNDVENVDENIAYNTFGTIVHNTLEKLYQPLIGKTLTSENLNPLKSQISSIIKRCFGSFYDPEDIKSGQNLIAFHVIQKYVEVFINYDIERSKKHTLIIEALEKPLKASISSPDLSIPVFIKGTLDRLERVDDTLQILDYKTGMVLPSETEIVDLEEAITMEKKSKAFQLLCYALMVYKDDPNINMLAGIVPIKDLSSGILRFAVKSGVRSAKNHSITAEELSNFEELLGVLISEILHPKHPFKDSSSMVL